MTDKEAVMILECMATSLMEAWTGLSNKDPLTDVIDQRMKAIDVAQAALKEREKRKAPCDLCKYNPPSSCDGKPCTMCPACAAGN